MIMTTWQGIVTVLMAVLGTIITRLLLVVYSLKNVNPFAGSHGIPEAIAIAAIVVLHVWKRNMLLSIAGGTVVYMALLQLVFA